MALSIFHIERSLRRMREAKAICFVLFVEPIMHIIDVSINFTNRDDRRELTSGSAQGGGERGVNR